MQTTAQLTAAFRTVDDGRLHVLAEADVHGLESFTMPFSPSGSSPYAGRDLQNYYRPVPDPSGTNRSSSDQCPSAGHA